jgi:SulP family sulfate permease
MTRMALPTLPAPKLVQCLRQGYSLTTLANDLIAGVTVGLVALPLAMAFAIASGLPPQNGIYCAVIAGFTVSTACSCARSWPA